MTQNTFNTANPRDKPNVSLARTRGIWSWFGLVSGRKFERYDAPTWTDNSKCFFCPALETVATIARFQNRTQTSLLTFLCCFSDSLSPIIFKIHMVISNYFHYVNYPCSEESSEEVVCLNHWKNHWFIKITLLQYLTIFMRRNFRHILINYAGCTSTGLNGLHSEFPKWNVCFVPVNLLAWSLSLSPPETARGVTQLHQAFEKILVFHDIPFHVMEHDQTICVYPFWTSLRKLLLEE